LLLQLLEKIWADFNYCFSSIKAAVNRGAKVVKEPWEESDENGSVTFATIQTVCDDCFMRPTGYK
jgi:4-hydroxyphenylpyruvate dioxygenase